MSAKRAATYEISGLTCGHCITSVRVAVTEAGYEVRS